MKKEIFEAASVQLVFKISVEIIVRLCVEKRLIAVIVLSKHTQSRISCFRKRKNSSTQRKQKQIRRRKGRMRERERKLEKKMATLERRST